MITATICRYTLQIFKDHYVDKDNKHKALKGKDGFVDVTGRAMTIDQFIEAITSPEPREPLRRRK